MRSSQQVPDLRHSQGLIDPWGRRCLLAPWGCSGALHTREPCAPPGPLGPGHRSRGCSWLILQSEPLRRLGLAYRVPECELPLTHPAEAGAEQLPVCGEDGPQRAGALVRPGSLLLAGLVG